MKQVLTFSKEDFLKYLKELNIDDTNVEQTTNICIISISSGSDVKTMYKKPFQKNYKNVLQLNFDNSIDDKSGFTEKHAVEIILFLKNNLSKTLYLIHCSDGIARSGSIGEFIVHLHGLSYNTFRLKNKKVKSNSDILKLLISTLIKK